ncbi:MAG: cysteine hydrolase [Chloroflexota bacterium]|nr:cysteine hydrolase [Chloroflexota bacterium]
MTRPLDRMPRQAWSISRTISTIPLWNPATPHAEGNAACLVGVWRAGGRPLVHIQHRSVNPDSPLWPEKPGVAIKSVVTPRDGEPLMTKTVNNAFVGTGLEQFLRERQIAQVVIAGLTTNHCVDTTTRMAGDLGFNPILVSDASATFDRTGPDGVTWPAETVHAVTMANLLDEFAEIAMTDEILERMG